MRFFDDIFECISHCCGYCDDTNDSPSARIVTSSSPSHHNTNTFNNRSDTVDTHHNESRPNRSSNNGSPLSTAGSAVSFPDSTDAQSGGSLTRDISETENGLGRDTSSPQLTPSITPLNDVPPGNANFEEAESGSSTPVQGELQHNINAIDTSSQTNGFSDSLQTRSTRSGESIDPRDIAPYTPTSGNASRTGFLGVAYSSRSSSYHSSDSGDDSSQRPHPPNQRQSGRRYRNDPDYPQNDRHLPHFTVN